ncbi:hypothetical protein [Streptomyces sp. NPDC056169]|uniref:hypothetical protein n=1 Tax=Streptomyces sp. NPDC056169 TaxID=3345734 RepID=UPI0035E12791
MRTRGSGPRARALLSGAALLTAGVLAAGLLTPSAQASSSAATRLPAAASSADPGREHAEIARKVMADPLGRAGMEAHEALHVEDGGRNLAIIWFDVTDFPRHVYRRITKQFDNLDFGIGLPGSSGKTDRRRYEGRGRVLRHAGKEALFERLGMSPDRTVLELIAVNVPVSRTEGAYDAAGVHSEALIYEKILRPFLRQLGLSAEEADTLLGKAVGGFSDRARCPACHCGEDHRRRSAGSRVAQGPGRVLVGSDGRGVDRHQPLDVTGRVGLGLGGSEHALEGVVLGPPAEAGVERGPGAEPIGTSRQTTPVRNCHTIPWRRITRP